MSANRKPKRPPSPSQKVRETVPARRAIATICESWYAAVEEANSFGYPHQSPGLRAVPTEVYMDPNDPLHTRMMPAASTKSSSHSDPTGDIALTADTAASWLGRTRRPLKVLLAATGRYEKVQEVLPPPKLRKSLEMAAVEVIDDWPKGCPELLAVIHGLANEARALFPPTPKRGEIVDGIAVNVKTDTSEVCTECGGPIGANAKDPLKRIDDRPYHKAPCYDTARQRIHRAAKSKKKAS